MEGYRGKAARAACVAALVAFASGTPAFATVELDQSALVVAGANSSGSISVGFGTFRDAPPPIPSPAYTYLVQSATAGKTGYLDHLDVQLTRMLSTLSPRQGSVVLSLYDGDFAAGTGSLVTESSISVDTLPSFGGIPTDYALFDLRDAGFFVTSGQVFSFRVEFLSTAEVTQTISGVIGNVEIVTDPAWGVVPKFNDYARGEARSGNSVEGILGVLDGDLGFRSFVDVTAPAVPEPASWALMVGGFAAVGGAMRRRPARVTYA